MGATSMLWFLTFTSAWWLVSGFDVLSIRSEEVLTHHLIVKELSADFEAIPVERSNLTKKQKNWGSLGVRRRVGLSAAGKSVEAASLSGLLVAVVQQDLSVCDLVLAYDAGDLHSVVVQDLLLLLPNPRQVVLVRRAEDLAGVGWVSAGCGGYLLLLDHPEPLLTFANTHHHTWDYHGRYVMVSGSVEQMEALAAARNGKKTEHILGAVKGGQEGEWRVYINMLYWGEGVRPVTTWRHHRFTSQLDLFPDKLSDLRGAVLKVATFNLVPSIMEYRAVNGSLLFRYGRDVAVMEMIAGVLNFLPFFAKPADGNLWGWRVNGTQWTGLLGELNRDEADIGLANLYIMINRVEALDYSAPFSDDGSCFMARVEPPLPRWQALAFPFHPWTWLAIMAGLILSGPVLFLLTSGSKQCGKEATSLASLSSAWLYTFGLHFREPQASEPHRNTTRIFVVFLWLYTTILTIAYSTNLTAFLLVTKSPASIETIEQLYESGLEVSGLGALITDKSEYFTRKYKVYQTTDEAFTEVMKGESVFWGSKGLLKFHIVTKFTALGVSRARIMRECFMPYHIAMGLQRHSPLKRKFDEVIGWIKQSGILGNAVSQALRLAATTKEYGGGGGEEAVQEAAEEGEVVALNLDHMQGVFMLAGIGWVIAIHVFVVEIFVIKH